MSTSIVLGSSGVLLDIFGDYGVLRLADVARGLSRIYRYNGQTARKMTVAQHSVLVSRACQRLYGRYGLQGLLHDGHEFIIGDIVHPVKEALELMAPGVWGEFEAMVAGKFRHRFGIPKHLAPEVSAVDKEVRRIEVYNLTTAKEASAYADTGLLPLANNVELWDEEQSYDEFIRAAYTYGLRGM